VPAYWLPAPTRTPKQLREALAATPERCLDSQCGAEAPCEVCTVAAAWYGPTAACRACRDALDRSRAALEGR
jgi:hypothetical protein